MKITAFLLPVLTFAGFTSFSQDIRVHDPVMIRQGDTYYLFCTGMGISVYSSSDMQNWKREAPVFAAPPQWAVETVPGYKGHTWAPDIFFHDGLYYLYYSVSAFGKNTSCIGVATNKTLDPEDDGFGWTDHGKVIQSVPGRDLWNAIDPNLAMDEGGTPWLVFGSFWSGMKMVKLDSGLLKVAQPEEWHTVARRARDFKTGDANAGEGAIEAPFIFRKDGLYYLFVSFDFCCKGVESNYKVMVGRSEDIRGPYVDKEGIRLDHGGGTQVVAGNEAWPGVGHNAAYTFDGKDYLVFHAYDAADNGRPKLKVKEMQWDKEGWPVVTLD